MGTGGSVLRWISVGIKDFAVLFIALPAIAACAPEVDDPIRIAVLDLDPETGGYAMQVRELRTLEDPFALRGEAAELRVGVTIRQKKAEPWDRLYYEDEGEPPAAQYLDQDGVLWPADFDSLGLATTYAHLERIREYALARGLPEDALRGVVD